MRRNALLTLVALSAIIALAWGLHGDAPRTDDTSKHPAPSQIEAAGMRVTIDPATRDVVDAPPPAQASPEDLGDALGTSSEGLEQIPSPVGGGTMVDLKGRFQNTYTATIDASGNLSAECDLLKMQHTGASAGGKE